MLYNNLKQVLGENYSIASVNKLIDTIRLALAIGAPTVNCTLGEFLLSEQQFRKACWTTFYREDHYDMLGKPWYLQARTGVQCTKESDLLKCADRFLESWHSDLPGLETYKMFRHYAGSSHVDDGCVVPLYVMEAVPSLMQFTDLSDNLTARSEVVLLFKVMGAPVESMDSFLREVQHTNGFNLLRVIAPDGNTVVAVEGGSSAYTDGGFGPADRPFDYSKEYIEAFNDATHGRGDAKAIDLKLTHSTTWEDGWSEQAFRGLIGGEQ